MDNRPYVYAWLKDNNFDGIIKTKVTVEYGRGELKNAETLQNALAKNNICSSLSQDIHSQTLKAFVKEQIAAGSDIPLELFGARPTWVAKIK